MSKRIALKSFSSRSYGVIARQRPVRAMHSLQPMLAHLPALTQDGDPPVEARLPADSVKADCTETTGHFSDRNHPLVNGSDPMRIKVLVFFANAPPSLREMLNRILQSENYETLWAASDREVVELLQNEQPDLLLLDFNRQLKRAMNTLEQLQAVNAFVPVILVAEQRAELAHAEAGRVAALIWKPFAVSLLLQTMRDVLTPLAEAGPTGCSGTARP